MIYYVLRGPKFSLEVHENKLKLTRRAWSKLLFKQPSITTWDIEGLASFSMTSPRLFGIGRLEWQSANGHRGSFRFTTNADMVKKIERYLQEKIAKNVAKELGAAKKFRLKVA